MSNISKAIFMLVLLAPIANAEGTNTFDILLSAKRVTFKDGAVTKVYEDDKLFSGDHVLITTVYHNITDQEIEGWTASVKIPGSLCMTDDMIVPEPDYVLLGNKEIKWPLTTRQLQVFSLSDVKAVFWKQPSLGPKGKKTFQTSMKVK